jgi:hypothetical protein
MGTADVRFGSKADVAASICDVRFTPESGHSPTRSGCLLGAKSRLMHRSKQFRYLITYSTRCESYRELEAGAGRVSFDDVRISSLAAR